jgi:ferredoxin
MAMKVTVDQDKCAASGRCVMTEPEVFDQREEDGVVLLLQANPPDELADAVRQAEVLCPARAITVQE